MANLGIDVPPIKSKPPRALALLGSAIWILASLPFFFLAYLYWGGAGSLFVQWRGWVFALAALACMLMATIVPSRYRLAIAGTKVRAWARLG